jgi:hypothetical protein
MFGIILILLMANIIAGIIKNDLVLVLAWLSSLAGWATSLILTAKIVTKKLD